MQDYRSYISQFSFRFLQPGTPLRNDRWYTRGPEKCDPRKLLELKESPLDVVNTRVLRDEHRLKRILRDLCSMPRMSTFAIGALINGGVARMPAGQAFLNVGVWHGFTLLAGMVGNKDKTCIGVDNFSSCGQPRESFMARFEAHRGDAHRFYDTDYVDYFRHHTEPIGLYMYDGDHSYDNQLRALQVAEEFFADDCVVLIDDTNWAEPREASFEFMVSSSNSYTVLLDAPTSHTSHPTFWNGLMILQHSGAKRRQFGSNGMGGSRQFADRPDSDPRGILPRETERPSRVMSESGEDQPRGTHSLVSIIIVNRNQGEHLHHVVESALSQTYPDTEVIVVNERPGCESSEANRGYGDRVVRVVPPGDGRLPAFELAVGVSRGGFVCPVDGDVILPPQAVEMAINAEAARTAADRVWRERVNLAIEEMRTIIPANASFVLVDDNKWGHQYGGPGRAIPFLERDGHYWGRPPDDATAIRELGRLRLGGARFIIFVWPAFWWLDHYRDFTAHLRASFECMLENDRVVAFDLGG